MIYLSTQIDSLSIRIESSSKDATGSIDKLVASLEKLQNIKGVNQVSSSLNKIASALDKVKASSGGGIQAIKAISTAFGNLSNIEKAGGLASVLRTVKKLPEAMSTISSFDAGDAEKIRSFASGISALSGIQAGGLGTLVGSIKRLPEAFEALNDTAIEGIEKKAKALSSALEPLNKQIETLARVTNKTLEPFNKAAKGADKFGDELDDAGDKSSSLKDKLGGLTKGLLEFAGNALGLHSVSDAIATSLTAAKEWDGISARFGEGFAEGADEAYTHVQKLSDALYINDQAFMQYSSNFATLARGFGVAEEAIADISIGLTELGYDIYAKNNDFYTFEEAMMAVRSAIVGEVEPIRLAGISITEATLKETAAANGITLSVEKMTEAQKAMLRYKAMIDQAYSSGTVGTYIQEINTAEGMSRALAQQLKGLAQAFGSALLPMVAAVLPYIQAFVSLITMAISAVAGLFGVKIKTPTWSSGMNDLAAGAGGATEAVDKTTDALGGASKEAKKLKDYMMGFDELNVITPPNESSGGGGGGGVGGGGLSDDMGLDFDSLWSDTMIESANAKAQQLVEDAMKVIRPVINWLKENLDHVLDVVSAIGAGLLGWKIAQGVAEVLDGLKVGGKIREWFAKNKVAIGVGIMVTGFTLSSAGAYALGYEGFTWANLLKTVIGDALIVGGSLLTFGTGPVGWTVGIGLAVITTIVSFTMGARKKALESMYGDTKLTAEEIKSVVASMFDFDVEARINLIDTTISNEEAAKKQLSESITRLSANLKPITLGVDTSPEAISALGATASTVVTNLTSLLASRKETVSVALELVPPVSKSGEDMTESILSASISSNDVITKWATDIGKQITDLISKGATSGLTELETKLLEGLTQSLIKVANAAAVGEARGAWEANMKMLFASADRDSFKEIIDQYDTALSDLEEKNQEIASLQYAGLHSNLASLEALAQSYKDMGQEVPAETQAAIDEAKKAIEEYDPVASVELAMEGAKETGSAMILEAMRSMVEVDLSTLSDSTSHIGDFVAFSIGQAIATTDNASDAADHVTMLLSRVAQEVTNGDKVMLDAMDAYGWTGWDLMTTETQKAFYDLLVDASSVEEAQEILTQAGIDYTHLISEGVKSGAPDVGAAAATAAQELTDGFVNNIDTNGDGKIAQTIEDVNGIVNSTLDVGEATSELAKTGADMADDITGADGIGSITSKAETAWGGVTSGVDTAASDAVSAFDLMAVDAGSAFGELDKNAKMSIEKLPDWAGVNITEPIAAGFLTMGGDIEDTFGNTNENMKKSWEDMPSWSADVHDKVTNAWSNTDSWFKIKFDSAWQYVTVAWSGSQSWFANTWSKVKNVFASADTWFEGKFDDAWTKVKKVFSPWTKFFEDLWVDISDKFGEIGTSIGDVVSESVKSGINGILKWVEESVNDAIDVINKAIVMINKAPGVEVPKVQHVTISMMADGGYVGAGQLFIAREAGAEMVGSMNGHTAVANNDQIVEGISQGVYSAVVAAMSESDGGNMSVNVYLDGKKITESVEKYQRQRGASIMKGGVTYGY